ncbi:thioredoxin [Weissella kandleri]|uniref:thioredoxin n=1 Tax=Weissella kandleri TaxID=1616 RepID=UPI00387E9E0F
MTVTEVNDLDFDEKTSQGLVLVDMWAAWCGPCRMQSPVIEAAADQVDDVKFMKMDVDANPKTSEELGIQAIPTLLIKKDGKVVDRLIGYHPLNLVKQTLQKYA